MFVISIMEPLHVHTEELPQDPLSDFSIWRRFIEYRKEVQWDNILDQVETLESQFNLNPDGSKAWERFVNEPVIDQYGQVWMIWKSWDCYQIYKMPDDKDKFNYVFIDGLEVTPPILGEPIYKFSVGFDNFGDEEVLNIQMSDKINEYYCLISNHEREKWEAHRRWMKHDNDSYSSMEELRKIYERYGKWQRKQGNNSFNAKEIFGKIYDNYGRIQQKLAEASIINSLTMLQ